MPAALALVIGMRDNEARADSRTIAERLGIAHRNFMETVNKYREELEALNHMRFQTARGERKQGGGTAERVALLTEDQAVFLLTLSRNTPRVVALKLELARAFVAYRRAHEQRTGVYLPGHQALTDAVQAKAAASSNKDKVHMNVAKLVNKTVGVEAGMRGSIETELRGDLIVAEAIARRAFEQSEDHHDGYQNAKTALGQLRALLPPT